MKGAPKNSVKIGDFFKIDGKAMKIVHLSGKWAFLQEPGSYWGGAWRKVAYLKSLPVEVK